MQQQNATNASSVSCQLKVNVLLWRFGAPDLVDREQLQAFELVLQLSLGTDECMVAIQAICVMMLNSLQIADDC